MAGMVWKINGHDWAVDMMREHIRSGSMRHAYGFAGPQGIGKRTLALRFAQAVNCPNHTPDGDPCGTCRTCRQIESMAQADLHVVQSAFPGDSLKVDQVRQLTHDLSLSPYESRYRVALLLRFQEATPGAQNALLKTLEEPNPNVLILLTADDPDSLLPTVISRCEWLRLRPMAVNDLSKTLGALHQVPAEQANLIARASGGRLGAALRLAREEGGLEERRHWLETCVALLDDDRSGRLVFSWKLAGPRKRDRQDIKNDLWAAFTQWQSFWRDVMLTSSGSPTLITNIDFQDGIADIAKQVSPIAAAGYIRSLERGLARLQHANLWLMLDALLLAWPHIPLESSSSRK